MRTRLPRQFRVCFPYLAQLHQTPHSLPIAVELALRHPEIDVSIAAFTEQHLDFTRAYARRFPGARLSFHLLTLPNFLRSGMGRAGRKGARKIIGIALNRRYFNSFDALVVPERTSLRLRQLGVTRPRLIWTGHGAGDRASGVADNIGKLDFVMMAGSKLERRLRARGLLHPGRYVSGVYAKLDYVRAMARDRKPLFTNGRPTVLYNPHFRTALSSWPLVGRSVLDWFADQSDYNCVFAPHVRLFDPPTPHKYEAFAKYQGLPHMRIDLGSQASIDMTYSLGADIYLGDVSSQVAEFVLSPRPCVFLNPRGVAWEGDPNYRFWTLGEVVEGPENLGRALAAAVARQPKRAPAQEAYVRDTFGAPDRPTAHIGADAVAMYLAGLAMASTQLFQGFG